MATFKRGDVVVVNLEPSLGSEQDLTRPCIIMSDLKDIKASNARSLYVIIPLTRSTTLTGLLAPRLLAKDHGLPADSTALLMHLRSIDPRRIKAKVTTLKADGILEIQKGLELLLGFTPK